MSSGSPTSADFGKDKSSFDSKAVWRTFWILLCITVFELIVAIVYYETHFFPKHILNGVFIIMTLAKAFFIVAEFMHLGHEIRNLVMTIAIPACLFIWFLRQNWNDQPIIKQRIGDRSSWSTTENVLQRSRVISCYFYGH